MPNLSPAPVLHNSILERLGTEIVQGVRPAGSVITLAQLEDEAGVSRTVIREVVRILESMGMVESRRRVGVTVLPATSWSVLDPQLIRWRLTGAERLAQLHRLTEMRLALEPTAARLAARRATAEVGIELLDLASRLRILGEAGRGHEQPYLETDIAFHALLLAASGNDMIASLHGIVTEVLASRTDLGLSPAHPVAVAFDNHEGVARAIMSRDENLAEQYARAVVMEVWQELSDL
ncbi:FadR family transcriptional regulator [Arthrobacter cheniae]|uniref:FadR family transcriptional regulator n=1 Tax=Arthrobacter cheniae TaxID=1258888 RepID=A0A3A5MDM0_9MICC|nr:FCD domain-containing protein [Arthrobacter cheniae]RJT79910.1 FadR family transcriptional regulator [Arthrobacter cheniae]